MNPTIRIATSDDEEYLAEACIRIGRHMRRQTKDKYIAGFPDEVTQEVRDWMASHIGSEERVAFVAETESGDRIGCILGMLGESSLSMAVPEKAGGITVCWVEEHAQRQGVGRSLLEAVEAWFLDRNVRHLEVSYMTGNETAAAAWEHLGFKPFRAFAYKEI